jgi:hypothetical protein
MIRPVSLAVAILSGLPVLAEEPKAKDPPAAKTLFDGKSLDGWKSSFEEFGGKIHVRDGAIVMEKGKKMTGVTYAKKDFPKTDYEVTLEGKKVEGGDFFCTTTFPVGDAHASLVVGGWGGQVIGLSSINGSDASENETTGSMEFKEGQWYKVRIRVTGPKVEAWIGDEKVVDVARKGKTFSTRIECEACHPFGVATYDTVGAVRGIKVRPLTDAEKTGAEKK